MGRILMREKTNKEDVFDLIQKHPESLYDDYISATIGITPRQQVQQLCNRLAASNRIRRKSRNSRRRALVAVLSLAIKRCRIARNRRRERPMATACLRRHVKRQNKFATWRGGHGTPRHELVDNSMVVSETEQQ